jgi:hypothetical protein
VLRVVVVAYYLAISVCNLLILSDHAGLLLQISGGYKGFPINTGGRPPVLVCDAFISKE